MPQNSRIDHLTNLQLILQLSKCNDILYDRYRQLIQLEFNTINPCNRAEELVTRNRIIKIILNYSRSCTNELYSKYELIRDSLNLQDMNSSKVNITKICGNRDEMIQCILNTELNIGDAVNLLLDKLEFNNHYINQICKNMESIYD
jgi:hypothetical protein